MESAYRYVVGVEYGWLFSQKNSIVDVWLGSKYVFLYMNIKTMLMFKSCAK